MNPTHNPMAPAPGLFDLKSLLEKAKAHQEALAVTGIVVILLALFVPYYLHSRSQSEKDAAGVLSLGQYYLRANVDPQNGPFKSTDEKYKQCLQTFQRINTDYAGTSAAKLSKYYVAQCEYFMGQYAQAYPAFDGAARELKGTPLGEEAELGKVLCLMCQNQWNQAQQVASAYLTDHPGSFLAPEVKLDLSDIYNELSDKAKALEQLKQVAKDSADTSWGKEASRRLAKFQS